MNYPLTLIIIGFDIHPNQLKLKENCKTHLTFTYFNQDNSGTLQILYLLVIEDSDFSHDPFIVDFSIY